MQGVSFTSVIPVKVIANGIETIDEETVRKGCNAVIREISGPIRTSENPIIRPAAAMLSTMDPHYNYFLAYSNGYKSLNKNSTNSDYFKTIIGKAGHGYIVTGPRVLDIDAAGYEIGKAKKECKELKIETSDRLKNAYWEYQATIKRIGSDGNERIREIFDRRTCKKYGNKQQMEVYITTKSVKRGYKSAVVVKSIDDIKFSNR